MGPPHRDVDVGQSRWDVVVIVAVNSRRGVAVSDNDVDTAVVFVRMQLM